MFHDHTRSNPSARCQLAAELQYARVVREAAERLIVGYTPSPVLGPSAYDRSRAQAVAVAEARQRLVGEIVGPGAILPRF